LKERDGGAIKKTLLKNLQADDQKPVRQRSLNRGSVVEAVISKGTVDKKIIVQEKK
jgi:hypothetical protein